MKILAHRFLLSVSLAILAASHAVAQAPAPTPSDDALKAFNAQISAHWKAKEWPQAEALTRQLIATTPTPATSRLRDLRTLLRLQGKTDEVAKLGLEITKRKDANSGDHNSVCWNFLIQNQALQARPYCETAVKLEADSFPALVNLGHTYLLAGDAAAAQPWYAKTLANVPTEKDLQEGPLGDFDLFIKNGWQVPAATTARNWFDTSWPALKAIQKLRREASTLESDDKEAQAAPLLEQAIQQSTTLLGADNDITQTLNVRLGRVLNAAGLAAYNSGNMTQANQWFEKSVAQRQTKLGADHPDTLTSMGNLATTYSALGQNDKALAMEEKVLAARQTKLGADHPDTLTSMENLALTYRKMKQFPKAFAILEQAVPKRIARYGEADSPSASLAALLMVTAESLGRQSAVLNALTPTMLAKVRLQAQAIKAKGL